MKPLLRLRNIIMILIGVLGLLIKHWFSSSLLEPVYSYMGNFTVSFAIFFLINLATENRPNRFLSVLISLAIVEVFEFTNGFGIMANVYDPWDYLANVLGISFAYLIDVISYQIILTRQAKKESG